MSKLLSVYHHLPHPLKNFSASIRGYQLRWWRYGSETDRLIEEALERESWSLERWRAWQEDQLVFILRKARTKVPYYRKYWDDQQRKRGQASWEYLENWPVLTKEALRKNPYGFLADSAKHSKMSKEHTSGTSGKPLTFWLSRDAIQTWYALAEARWHRWYGVTLDDNWGIFGGQLVVSYQQSSAPFWVWNRALNQLYLSSYHLSTSNIIDYLQAIRSYNLVYLLGYASSLYTVAQIALEKNLKVPQLKLVLSNAEPLYNHQRDIISKAFQCPVYDTYGQSENVCAASECLSGNLHLWPDIGVTEIFADDEDELLPAETIGRIICTGFINHNMPLIRYAVGDRGGMIDESSGSCSCGRSLPMLAKIEGRNDDVILTPDGRKIGRLDPVFKDNLPIREAQIIQESLSMIRVRYVPLSEFTQADGNSVVERLRQRIGDMDIVLEPVDSIPRTANGKFRAVISHLSC